ncbi:MAG: hypothetical protein Q8K99_10035, partial [Actinomycetota bacterium]|nr:hypothetical protein [Actinomycetota bacterium]
SAKFAILQYTITATAGLNGTITPSGIVQINHGASQNFRIRPNTGYQVDSIFVNGVYAGNDTSYTFTNVTSNQIIHGTFAPRTLTITIGTNPVGRRFIVDGNIYDSTQTFNWTAAETHTISTDSIQLGVIGTQYVWNSWTNGGTRTSNVAPLVNTTYTANFTTQHYLTMIANTGGSVTPPSGWFNRGQSVVITAIPDSKYEFSSWSGTGSGSYSGSGNPRTITIDGAINQTASFIRLPVQITIGTNFSGLTFRYNGVDYTTTQTRTVTPGTSQSISTTSPQPGATNTRYAWQNWSDGGAISHSIIPNSDSSFIANFLTQYYLTMSSTPNGTVFPVTGWQDSGRVLQIKATPNTGYAFRGWIGTGAGSYTGMLDSTNIQILNPITQSATFTLDTMIITASAGANGRITPSGSVKVPYGSSQTFT